MSFGANFAAFLTVSQLEAPIESLDDLVKQYKVSYATQLNSGPMAYFQTMAKIEETFYEIWKSMAFNKSATIQDRARLAVFDYPISTKYTKMWQAMQEAGFPATIQEAVARIRNSSQNFALVGDATDIRYHVMSSCDLKFVGEEFNGQPFAIAVQQGSPLREQINQA